MFDTYHLFLTGAMLDQANRAKGMFNSNLIISMLQ